MAGIYLHIPYCKQACNYCDFHFSTTLGSMSAMQSAMLNEIKTRAAAGWNQRSYSSIYFGGGTPSLLPSAQLFELIFFLKTHLTVEDRAEITLEANPDDITPEKLEAWLKMGINRLSVGLQSFHETDLKWMNRAHGADDAAKAVSAIKHAGFTNFSVDLIYGLPLWKGHEWEENLARIAELSVPHVSCYILTVESKTQLGHLVKKGSISMVDEAIPEQYRLLCDQFGKAGYEHYEVSNFALPNNRSHHNGSYWTGESYLGIGPGAHGFDGVTRYWNKASNQGYISAQGLISEQEVLTEKDAFNELIMTRLRTIEGLNLEDCRKRFGKLPSDIDGEAWNQYLIGGELVLSNQCVKIAEESWLIGDRIASDFFWV